MTVREYQFRLPITDDKALHLFVEKALGISIPNTHICEGHDTPFEAFSYAYFAKEPIIVWHAARGFGGKSITLAALGLTEAITLKADVNILGGSGEQSQNVHKYNQLFWNNPGMASAKNKLLSSPPTQRETTLSYGNTIRALLASQTSVRGPHPQRLRCDEIDEMDIKILDAALGQPMSARGIKPQTVLSSTWQNPGGTMTEIMRRARNKGWRVFRWCIGGDCLVMGKNKDIPIKDIRPGDIIYSHKDDNIIQTEVLDAWKSGTKKTITIKTDGGSLVCTPEHRVLTRQGWKEAKDISEKDVVCCVRNERGNTRRTNVQNVQIQQQMRRLREINRQRRYKMPKLRRKNTPKFSAQKTRKNGLPRLRRVQTAKIKKVQKLLFKMVFGEKQNKRRDACKSKNKNIEKWQQQEKNKQSRASRRRIVEVFWNKIRKIYLRWKIFRGFLFAGTQNCFRGKRDLLAYSPRSNRKRQDKGGPNKTNGVGVVGVLGKQTPHVDYAVVRKVEFGGEIDVYDLTVKEGHSFIANGIIVHNCMEETKQPHGWLPQSDIDSKKKTVTELMWKNEYCLAVPTSESLAIHPSSLDMLFDKSMGEYKGGLGEKIELDPLTPKEREAWEIKRREEGINDPYPDYVRFLTGADWAKEQDNTVIFVIREDCNPMRLVAFYRMGRAPWPAMVGKFDEYNKKYKGRSYHDNTGLGDVIDDYLETNSRGVNMVGKKRKDMLTDCIGTIERQQLVMPYIRYVYEELSQASWNDVYGSGHLPDALSALSLTLLGAGKPNVLELIEYID